LLIGEAEFGDRLQEKVKGSGDVEGLVHKNYSIRIFS
jgi:hypothetical protein